MNPIALMLQRLFGSTPPAPLGPTGAAAGLTPEVLFDRIASLILDAAQGIVSVLAEELWIVLLVLLPILLVLNLGYMLFKMIWGMASGAAVFASFLWSLVIYGVAGNLAMINYWFIGGIAALATFLSDAVSRGLGAGRVRTENAVFGSILNDALLMGVDLWRSLGWNDLVGAILVVALMTAAIISIAYAWWMWFKAGLWLLVLSAMAPFYLTCALHIVTRGLFFRWVDTVWGFIVLKMTVIVFASILLGVEGILITQIVSTSSGVADKILLLICAILVFIAMLLMSWDIPRVAASIGGGAIMHGPGATTGFAMGYASRAYSSYRSRVDARNSRDQATADRMREANP